MNDTQYVWFEIVAALLLLVITLLQRPGLKNERYSRKYNIWASSAGSANKPGVPIISIRG